MDALSSEHLRAMTAAVRTTPIPLHPGGRKQAVIPFVTISREGGAGGRTVARHLVDHLNQLDPAEDPWRVWDKELVEKVASDHHLSEQSVASLGETHRTWLEDFIRSLSQVPEADETIVYRRVAMTVRTLAQKGRAVIVGRGGAFVTARMPGGVHCRLVAPLSYRVQHMAEQLSVSTEVAAEHVRQLDHNRQAFYRRYWPQQVGRTDLFSITLNMSLVTEEQAAEAILQLVLPKPLRQA